MAATNKSQSPQEDDCKYEMMGQQTEIKKPDSSSGFLF
jgi:hypothetical protein